MTRQDFIDSLILKGEADIKGKLELRDNLRGYAQEIDDINDFVKNTKHFKVVRLITPFGECPLIVERDDIKDMIAYMGSNKLYNGFSMLEMN